MIRNTQSILLYMESVGDARSFLSAAREVALKKPIIVIKAGRTEAASQAAASHTGALTGSDEVLDAAFRRCGVLRVQNIADLFLHGGSAGQAAAPQRTAADHCHQCRRPGRARHGCADRQRRRTGRPFRPDAGAARTISPAALEPHNPIDILGDADPERYAKALEIAAQQSQQRRPARGPRAARDDESREVAEKLKPFAKSGKPILASWMGGESIAAGEAILNAGGIPTFNYPDTAARAFTYMWRYSYNLRALYETPVLAEGTRQPIACEAAPPHHSSARERGRILLTEVESKQMLAFYGIPTVETRIARSEHEAVKRPREIGYPVVLKLYSETITHKTDVGGVKLNLQNEAAVRDAFQRNQVRR